MLHQRSLDLKNPADHLFMCFTILVFMDRGHLFPNSKRNTVGNELFSCFDVGLFATGAQWHWAIFLLTSLETAKLQPNQAGRTYNLRWFDMVRVIILA